MAATTCDYIETYTGGWFDLSGDDPESISVYTSGWFCGLETTALFPTSAGDGICIDTHEEDAKNRLIEQYKKKPRIEGLVSALGAKQYQDIEDGICGLFDRLNIDLSEGVQLDGIGQIVGQKRMGASDDVYRLFLKTKVSANNSKSSIEDVISAWTILTGSENIEVKEIFPATVQISSDFNIPSPFDALIKDLLQDILGAGVRLEGILVFDPENAFAFAETPDNPNTGGFGDLNDPNVGGEFARFV